MNILRCERDDDAMDTASSEDQKIKMLQQYIKRAPLVCIEEEVSQGVIRFDPFSALTSQVHYTLCFCWEAAILWPSGPGQDISGALVFSVQVHVLYPYVLKVSTRGKIVRMKVFPSLWFLPGG